MRALLSSSLDRHLPRFCFAIYALAVSIGTFAGGLWGGLSIGGGLLMFAGTWISRGERPHVDRAIASLFGLVIVVIALLNLHTDYPAEAWKIWFRVVTILVPLALLFSPEVQARILHNKLFPVLAMVACLGAYALGIELFLQAPVLHIVKGLDASLTEYNRGISYLVIFSFSLMAYLWSTGRYWQCLCLILILLFPSSLTESRATRMALICGLATTIVAFPFPILTRRVLAAVLVALLAFPLPFAMWNVFPQHQAWLNHLAPSWQNRVEIWDYISFRIFERPLLGWGMGSSHLIPYLQPHGNLYHYVMTEAPHPHNVILQLWVELGLPGLALGVVFALVVLKKASRLPSRIRPFAYGCWMASLCISLVAYNFWSDSLFGLFALTGLAFILLAKQQATIVKPKSSPMRILHIMAGKDNGGAETYSTDVMLSLHQAGFDQCVIMQEGALRTPELTAAGLRMETAALRSPFHFWRRRKIARVIAREQPDIIHCWMRRAATLTSGLDIHAQALIGWFGDYEKLRYFRHCTHLVGVTQDIVAHMHKNGFPADKATYIPTFPTIDDAPALNRATLNTPKDATVLLTLSRLHPVKGLDTLMHAIKDMPNCYLWLAGEGPLHKELEQLAHKLDIQDRTRFLGWRTDRGALLRAADICVLPSRYEPFGTVILEAWESKTPFVACDSAGPAAYVRDGINGMLAPINDSAALAKALDRVINDAALRQKIVEQGFAEYHTHYTREAVTELWINYYRGLLKEEA